MFEYRKKEMEQEKLNSAKELLKSLDENFLNLKDVMKSGDEEKFKEIKESSKDIMGEMERIFSEEENSSDKKEVKKVKPAKTKK
ncbi:MAG: hypothetical protein Q8Q04_03735 [archaeon]|nr:hypothetical protein [archaeon]